MILPEKAHKYRGSKIISNPAGGPESEIYVRQLYILSFGKLLAQQIVF